MIIRVMVSRHSAFYSPLISTIAGGFLKRQGLDATYSALSPGQRSHALIREGAIDVMQAAVSSNWKPMEKGESPLAVHFAQINRKDGFFLVARKPDPSFEWRKLAGKALLADHGLQPFVMLRYAAQSQGVDWSGIHVLDEGTPERMEAAFRRGAGDYVHLQGPAAQTLEYDGAGQIVAAVGEAMPPVAFSSLCASRAFVESDECRAFLRACEEARRWVRESAADEVAACEQPFFPAVSQAALAAAVGRYQRLGCWEGGLQIPRDLYEQALNVFESAGEITRRHAYDEVCATV